MVAQVGEYIFSRGDNWTIEVFDQKGSKRTEIFIENEIPFDVVQVSEQFMLIATYSHSLFVVDLKSFQVL